MLLPASAITHPPFDRSQKQAFVALLKDTEAEVRTAAAARVTELARLLPGATVLGSFLPPIRDLAVDQSEHVFFVLFCFVGHHLLCGHPWAMMRDSIIDDRCICFFFSFFSQGTCAARWPA